MFVEGQKLGAGMGGRRERRWLYASMEDNLMTVAGGSGCLKELSIPAAPFSGEVKAICPTSKTKDPHTHASLLSLVLLADGGEALCQT